MPRPIAAQSSIYVDGKPLTAFASARDSGTGPNLPKDEAKVFGLFKRAHVEPPGSGIALYSIRKTLERYSGTIKVDSVLGEWTEFMLTFPNNEEIQNEGQN